MQGELRTQKAKLSKPYSRSKELLDEFSAQASIGFHARMIQEIAVRMGCGWAADGSRMGRGWAADGPRMGRGWAADGLRQSRKVESRINLIANEFRKQ